MEWTMGLALRDMATAGCEVFGMFSALASVPIDGAFSLAEGTLFARGRTPNEAR